MAGLEICGAFTVCFDSWIYTMLQILRIKQQKTANYESVQRTAIRFKEEMGSYICADLLKIDRRPQQLILMTE
jgi:hypothetical protein